MANKKAFTMLELVFILVILGILAAVGIPKISASRDDAKLVSLKSDINTLKTSFPAYFLSQGKGSFESAITLSSQNWDISPFNIKTKLQNNNAPCIIAKLMKDEAIETASENEIKFLEITTTGTKNENGNICEKLLYQIGLTSSSSIKIPLLSGSIVF
ncbi:MULTISPECIES: prepilin-type N-terminal cleavage/methylation domain-containing protein [Helicobacter]|uniref:Type II secretion system protein n=1 Tax=Helicobacter ibis TaxID=2962633 RepID=A0ABT4VG66_9HELI|nr:MULTISPECIES: type II secretion system protein [Helicobacter]MDA3968007.1 type II secretion system protein [Helicobacter sp. WB40]MDA3969682.1 type II secretion system protein [Helicobacter ibis]